VDDDAYGVSFPSDDGVVDFKSDGVVDVDGVVDFEPSEFVGFGHGAEEVFCEEDAFDDGSSGSGGVIADQFGNDDGGVSPSDIGGGMDKATWESAADTEV